MLQQGSNCGIRFHLFEEEVIEYLVSQLVNFRFGFHSIQNASGVNVAENQKVQNFTHSFQVKSSVTHVTKMSQEN